MPRRRQAGLRRGAQLVEVALILPVTLLILLGICEFGMIGSRRLTLSEVARAGARQASIGKTISDIKSTAISAGSGLSPAVTSAQITVAYNSNDTGTGTWITAGDNGLVNNAPYGRLVKVSVQNWKYTLITGSYFGWLPGVTNNQLSLSASVIMRRE